MQVRVVPPDPAWTALYHAEARSLRDALAGIEFEIHHIGSTAIRGIAAKPVIDILVVVADLDLLELRNDKLRILGYEAKGEFGIPHRRYFRKDSPQGIRTHQVHAFKQGSIEAHRHLVFRDYMNTHAEAAQAYSSLKQRLAAAFPNDMQSYIDGKNGFIKDYELRALAWRPHAPHRIEQRDGKP